MIQFPDADGSDTPSERFSVPLPLPTFAADTTPPPQAPAPVVYGPAPIAAEVSADVGHTAPDAPPHAGGEILGSAADPLVPPPAPAFPDPALAVVAAVTRPVADARDAQLLAAVRQMRAQLPSRGGGNLTVPCRVRYFSAEEAADDVLAQQRVTNALPASCRTYALDNFYASLRARAFGEKGLTRWSQFGDSLVVGDTMTGELRRLFQQQFGDGGHGFIYIGQPLRAFGFENIRVGASESWTIRTIVRHAAEGGGTFGLGGAEFRANDSSNISIQSPRDGEIGKNLEHFDVLYSTPSNTTTGTFRVTVDGDTHTERFDTVPDSSGKQRFSVAPGEHRVSLFGFTSGLRFHGVISETSGPGVVVDNIGQVSAREEHLLKIDADHWREQLAVRDPDVVSFFYGVNAASSNGARLEGRGNYPANYREVLRRATDGASQRDCLVMSLLTRGTREGGSIAPTGAVAVLNRAQRRAAMASGCAFFDTTGLMGGPDGTKKWADGKPTLLGADLAHPTPAGYREIARRLYADILDGFIAYLERRIAQSGGPR